jgi:hypothetical protein
MTYRESRGLRQPASSEHFFGDSSNCGRIWLDRERAMKRTDRFVGYSGETANELFSYPPKDQEVSLVQAFREGIQRKAARKGKRALSHEEQTVLAVTALEQEVNNGGYDQFLRNSSRVFAPIVVESLMRVGCKRQANITKRALEALHLTPLTVRKIDAVMRNESRERDQELEHCDQMFYKAQQSLAKRLCAFILANRTRIDF